MKFTQILFVFLIFAAAALASTPRCPDVCTAQYDPVCASNNKCIRVFSNSCQLGIVNCNARPNERFHQVAAHYCNNFKDPSFSKCSRTKN